MADKTETPVKKKKGKKLLKLLSIIIGAFLLFIVLIVLFINHIVVNAVEAIAPQVTQTNVTLEDVNISFIKGYFELNNLKIGNVEGYTQPNAFELDKFVVDVDTNTLLNKDLVVNEVTIDGVLIDFEVKLNGSNNLWDLKSNIDDFIAKNLPQAQEQQETEVATTEEQTTSEKPKQNIVIKNLTVQNISLMLAGGKISLPPIHIESDGTSLVDLVNNFFTELISSIGKALKDAGTTKLINNAGSALTDGAKSGAQEVNKAIDNVKNLFK